MKKFQYVVAALSMGSCVLPVYGMDRDDTHKSYFSRSQDGKRSDGGSDDIRRSSETRDHSNRSDGEQPIPTENLKAKKAEKKYQKALQRYNELENSAERHENDINTMLSWFTKAADLGHVEACLKLGKIYKNSSNIPDYKKKSLSYYQKAADLGSIPALKNVAESHLSNAGYFPKPTRAYEAAIACYNKAGSLGDVESYYDVAKLQSYLTDQTGQSTFPLYLEASNKGSLKAQREVGKRYMSGYGVDQNVVLGKQIIAESGLEAYARWKISQKKDDLDLTMENFLEGIKAESKEALINFLYLSSSFDGSYFEELNSVEKICVSLFPTIEFEEVEEGEEVEETTNDSMNKEIITYLQSPEADKSLLIEKIVEHFNLKENNTNSSSNS